MLKNHSSVSELLSVLALLLFLFILSPRALLLMFSLASSPCKIVRYLVCFCSKALLNGQTPIIIAHHSQLVLEVKVWIVNQPNSIKTV